MIAGTFNAKGTWEDFALVTPYGLVRWHERVSVWRLEPISEAWALVPAESVDDMLAMDKPRFRARNERLARIRDAAVGDIFTSFNIGKDTKK